MRGARRLYNYVAIKNAVDHLAACIKTSSETLIRRIQTHNRGHCHRFHDTRRAKRSIGSVFGYNFTGSYIFYVKTYNRIFHSRKNKWRKRIAHRGALLGNHSFTVVNPGT